MTKLLKNNEKLNLKSRGDKLTPKSGATAAPNQHPETPGGQHRQQLTYAESPRVLAPGMPGPYPYNNAHYQQQAIYAKSPPNAAAGGYYINNDHEDGVAMNGGELPPPPPPAPPLQSMEIYAESSRLSNGARTAKMSVQQASKSHYAPTGVMSERPHLPPPPVPTGDAGHLSDLQQIQQQVIRKFDVLALGNNNATGSEAVDTDLPPPPPPMHFDNAQSSTPSDAASSNGGIKPTLFINFPLVFWLYDLSVS